MSDENDGLEIFDDTSIDVSPQGYNRKDVRRNRLNIPNYKQVRNLKQYRDMTDDEFEEVFSKRLMGVTTNREFEFRIQKKLDEFAKDWEIEDMKSNDLLLVRALAQAFINLEDLENYMYNLRSEGINQDKILEIDKVNNVMSLLRRDISKFQDDLGITRKSRKSDKESSVVNYLAKLHEKAKKFYESKMFYVWCPKCSMLLFTGWFLYPEEKNNKLQLICNRTLESGEKCGHKLQITSKELYDRRGVNITDVPEFYK